MDALNYLAAAGLVLAAPVAARAAPVMSWRSHIEEASARFGLPVTWIERVMRAESGGRTALNGRPIVSHAGAMGLMQLMPGTWAEMRARLELGTDPHHPGDSILAGTYYLRLMYDRFGYPGLFAAYNAGPARYAAWARGRGRLPAETHAYLAQVAGSDSAHPDVAVATISSPLQRPTLFFSLGHDAASVPEPRTAGTLFVPLRTSHEAAPAARGPMSVSD